MKLSYFLTTGQLNKLPKISAKEDDDITLVLKTRDRAGNAVNITNIDLKISAKDSLDALIEKDETDGIDVQDNVATADFNTGSLGRTGKFTAQVRIDDSYVIAEFDMEVDGLIE